VLVLFLYGLQTMSLLEHCNEIQLCVLAIYMCLFVCVNYILDVLVFFILNINYI
jgi:hypothetical protein